MPRKKPVVRAPDEEIMQHTNVPVSVAATAIGWSSPTLYYALQENRVPFGFAVQNQETGTWAYNISPAGLIRYRNGEVKTTGMSELKEIWSDMAERVVDAKLEAFQGLVTALAATVSRP